MSRHPSHNRLDAHDPFDRFVPLIDGDDPAETRRTIDAGPPEPFRVTLCVEQCWITVLRADSRSDAEAKALELWEEDGAHAFTVGDILRVDAIDAEELP